MDKSTIEHESMQRFVDVKGIAKFLGCSKETIHRLLAKKKIPAHRVGRLWRFDPEEVAQWVREDKAEV